MNQGCKLLMPNHIVIKDGLACGDKVTLLYDFDNGVMRFQMISEGCIYCDRICEYLQKKFNLMPPAMVAGECAGLIEELQAEPGGVESLLHLPHKLARQECFTAPIKILKESAQEKRITHNQEDLGVSLYVDKMDCDACAVRENVSWLYEKQSHLHGRYSISSEKREMLMKLGKVSLKNVSVKKARDIYRSLGEDDFQFLEEYKLFPMVYQNLKKLGILDGEDGRWRLLVYQRQRTVMAYKEIVSLMKFIRSQNLKAFFVKGAYTYQFYEDPMMRNVTDFDLLVIEENHAFTIIEWLMKNDFKIFPDSFSLKKTRQRGKSVYTGHLHFQKIINLQYRLIVDINFTGFPMIRVASYVPEYVDGRVQLENMILITLCHLFKHREVFMKDINDLFLMLTSDRLRGEKLYHELKANGLLDLFAVAADFINREYELPDSAREYRGLCRRVFVERAVPYKNWPYSEEDVTKVKNTEFKKYAKDAVDYERLYLYPVLVFEGLCDVIAMDGRLEQSPDILIAERKRITEQMFQYKIDEFYFVFTPIGWFLEMKEYYVESMKSRIRELLETIMAVQKIDCVDIPYAIAFEEKWLDTEKE